MDFESLIEEIVNCNEVPKITYQEEVPEENTILAAFGFLDQISNKASEFLKSSEGNDIKELEGSEESLIDPGQFQGLDLAFRKLGELFTPTTIIDQIYKFLPEETQADTTKEYVMYRLEKSFASFGVKFDSFENLNIADLTDGMTNVPSYVDMVDKCTGSPTQDLQMPEMLKALEAGVTWDSIYEKGLAFFPPKHITKVLEIEGMDWDYYSRFPNESWDYELLSEHCPPIEILLRNIEKPWNWDRLGVNQNLLRQRLQLKLELSQSRLLLE